MRQWALARPRPVRAPLGASLLLARGVPAWLQALPAATTAAGPATTPLALRLPAAPPAAPSPLILVLATLVAYCPLEGAP